jgi:hypothetical protein
MFDRNLLLGMSWFREANRAVCLSVVPRAAMAILWAADTRVGIAAANPANHRRSFEDEEG